VRAQVGRSDETTISVNEIFCRNQGRPDVETVIGVIEAIRPTRTFRILKPISNVCEADVLHAIKDASL
jgi:hypothetical protein